MPSSSERSRGGCCGFFWGSFCPFFGHVSLLEAGGSYFIPTFLLFLTRLSTAIFIWTTLIYYVIRGRLTYEFYTVWSYTLVAVTFLFLTLSSFQLLLIPEKQENRSILGAISAPLSQVAFTAAVFILPVFWILIWNRQGPSFVDIAVHALNAVVGLVDVLLGSRVKARMSYGLTFIAYTLIYLAFVWIFYAITNRFPYKILDFRLSSAGITVGVYIGLVAWAFAAAILVLSIYRAVQAIAKCTGKTYHEEELPR